MPAVVFSRPQRTEQMFQALKRHIVKERQKKKQEQEADAEVERQRKEREAQQKQNVMTLGENREQIAQLEQLLAQLKDEKHQLFLKLKKVLNEDDNRRKQLVRHEVIDIYSNLYSAVPQMGGHISHLVMQPNYAVADHNTLYKVPPTHTLLQPNALKRTRTPSPPPQTSGFVSNYVKKVTVSRLTFQSKYKQLSREF
ncbi:hypothetical protein AAG570_012805 [Ranatra chinensis]|uniref:G protein pathway suppressor 2 n=1 Tax=Ranatra chinensis TaxID=642074 RepID=A0ABD0YF80_9HEMI